MIQVKINRNELLRYAQYLKEVQRATNAAVARALNQVGEDVKTEVATNLAVAMKQDVKAIERLMTIKLATPVDLLWRLDATKVAETQVIAGREWEGRDSSEFDEKKLVNIVTNSDDPCEVCLEAARNSPYTRAQIKTLQSKWLDFTPTGLSWLSALNRTPVTNLLHPNCHCIEVPFYARRKMPVGIDNMPPELMTVKQLGKVLKDAVKVSIAAVKKT